MRKRRVDLLEFGQFLLQRFQADRGTHSAAAMKAKPTSVPPTTLSFSIASTYLISPKRR